MNPIRRAFLGLGAVLAFLLSGLTPAQAAGELGLSPDGVHWAAALPGPLFDPAMLWVPGDAETATFYVRNQSSDAAFLDVDLVTGEVTSLLDAGDLSVGVSVDGGQITAVRTPGEHRLVDGFAVGAGQVHRVEVHVDFDAASTNLTQARRLDFDFRLALSQDASVSPPTDAGGDNGGDNGGGVAGPEHHSGDLPGTGTVVTPSLLLTAAALCATGLALAGWARRSRETKERQNSHA